MENTELEKKIISEARSWINPPTKWMHGVALKGYRTDCVQFIISLAKEFGWIPQDYKTFPYNQDYALHNDTSLIKQEIMKFCDEVTDGMKVGDIVLFKFGKCASHAGIYIGNNRVVHAHVRQGVIEDDIKNIVKPIDSIWRFNAQKII